MRKAALAFFSDWVDRCFSFQLWCSCFMNSKATDDTWCASRASASVRCSLWRKRSTSRSRSSKRRSCSRSLSCDPDVRPSMMLSTRRLPDVASSSAFRRRGTRRAPDRCGDGADR